MVRNNFICHAQRSAKPKSTLWVCALLVLMLFLSFLFLPLILAMIVTISSTVLAVLKIKQIDLINKSGITLFLDFVSGTDIKGIRFHLTYDEITHYEHKKEMVTIYTNNDRFDIGVAPGQEKMVTSNIKLRKIGINPVEFGSRLATIRATAESSIQKDS